MPSRTDSSLSILYRARFLHDLPVELMWGVGPATGRAWPRLGCLPLASSRDARGSLERLLGPAAAREVHRRSRGTETRVKYSHRRGRLGRRPVGAGQQPAQREGIRPALRHLADRIARLRAKSPTGTNGDCARPLCRSPLGHPFVTLEAPISATAILAEIRKTCTTVLADHPDETILSLLAISVSHLERACRPAA